MNDSIEKILNYLYKNDSGDFIDVTKAFNSKNIPSEETISQIYQELGDKISIESVYNHRGIVSVGDENIDTPILKSKITQKGREYYKSTNSGTYKIRIISGLVVAIVVLFLLKPLKDYIFSSTNQKQVLKSSQNTVQKTDIKKKGEESSDLSNTKNTKMDSLTKIKTNVYYLQSYSPIELFDDIIITLNKTIEFVNQDIELKIVKKKSGITQISKDKRIGDIWKIDDYTISLLELRQNISTYTLKIRIEKLQVEK